MCRLATFFHFGPAAILPWICTSFGRCRRSGSGFFREQFLEQSLGSLQSLICQDDRFAAPGGVGDHPLLVQPIHRIPGERLPNALAIVPPEQEQCEHAVIDFVNVDCHGEAVPSSWEKRRPRRGSPLSHVRYQAPQRELTASQAAVSGCHSTQLSSLARGPCRYWHTARRVSEIGGWTVSQLLTSRTSTVGRARVRCSPRT